MTRSSIAMREEANNLMNNILKGSIKYQETVVNAKLLVDLKEERIQKLTDHIHNLVSILDQAFDSDESIFANEELEQIVDALKYASIARPDILKGRTGWVEKMETRINDLPY